MSSAAASGSASSRKKKFLSAGPVSCGNSPVLIRCAFVTIMLCCAWRKISVSLITGIFPESMSERSTFPAPTDGSWSVSPIRMRVALGRIACIKRFIKTSSTIDISSTITTSASSGLRRFRLKPFSCGENSSRRCIVFASRPVVSLSRLAARPVGAVKAMRLPSASNSRIMPTVVVVLPVPGPPVRIIACSDSAV